MANVLDSDIEVSEFELESPYYFHLETKTNGKSMEPHISQLSVR